jgi:GTP cyclohydrolase I
MADAMKTLIDLRTILSWGDLHTVMTESDALAPVGAKVWGIPRGGIHIAQLLVQHFRCEMVESPGDADVIVDDIYDSGATYEKWTKRTQKPVWCAIDKRDERWKGRWIVMPWERQSEVYGLPDGETSCRRLLQWLGVDLGAPGMDETPARMARALAELTEGYGQHEKEILSKRFPATYDEMVVVRDIEFWSLCEHHVLPFHGTVTVGYLPKKHVVGLSKVARLVQCFAARLQIQERMTQEIAEAMKAELACDGVGVVVRATHLCMAMRGVKTPAEMITSTLLGNFREAEVRAEFLKLENGRMA